MSGVKGMRWAERKDPAEVKRRTMALGRWREMMRRCYEPSRPKYPYYGGRGIRVAERWHDFNLWWSDVGDPPEGMTLDRPDNDGDYGPDNWRWATHSEQRQNQRPRGAYVPRKVRAFRCFIGDTEVNMTTAAKHLGMRPPTLRAKLHKQHEKHGTVEFRFS